MEAKTLPADVCVFGRFGRLSPVADHTADSWFDSGVKWWIYVSSIVTYLWKNSFFLCWNCCKQPLEPLTCRFWSTVSKHSTLIDKYPCKIVNTRPSDIFNSSATSRNFNLWSAKISFGSFVVFSWTIAELRLPEHSASFVSVRTGLMSVYHLLIVVSDGSESE